MVGALWKVEDRGLGKFMAALHERLHAGDRPSEALRRARAAMLLSNRRELLDPFLWGAFVSTGSDRPIDATPVRAPEPTRDFAGAGLGLLAAFATLALLAAALTTGRRRDEKSAPGSTGGAG